MSENSFNIVGVQQIGWSDNAAKGLTLPTGISCARCIIAVTLNGVRWGSVANPPVSSSSGIIVPGTASTPGYLNFNDPFGNYLGMMKQIQFVPAVAGAFPTLDIVYLS